MVLGTEVGLGPGHILLHGDPAPLPKKGQSPPIFGQFLLWLNGWMYEEAIGTEVDLGPGHFVLDRFPGIRERGAAAPPVFGPCLLWPRSPISATAELLLLFFTHVAFLCFNVFKQKFCNIFILKMLEKCTHVHITKQQIKMTFYFVMLS